MKTIPMAFITLEVPRDIEAMLNDVALNCNNAICIFVVKSFLAYNNDNDDNSKNNDDDDDNYNNNDNDNTDGNNPQ